MPCTIMPINTALNCLLAWYLALTITTLNDNPSRYQHFTSSQSCCMNNKGWNPWAYFYPCSSPALHGHHGQIQLMALCMAAWNRNNWGMLGWAHFCVFPSFPTSCDTHVHDHLPCTCSSGIWRQHGLNVSLFDTIRCLPLNFSLINLLCWLNLLPLWAGSHARCPVSTFSTAPKVPLPTIACLRFAHIPATFCVTISDLRIIAFMFFSPPEYSSLGAQSDLP